MTQKIEIFSKAIWSVLGVFEVVLSVLEHPWVCKTHFWAQTSFNNFDVVFEPKVKKSKNPDLRGLVLGHGGEFWLEFAHAGPSWRDLSSLCTGSWFWVEEVSIWDPSNHWKMGLKVSTCKNYLFRLSSSTGYKRPLYRLETAQNWFFIEIWPRYMLQKQICGKNWKIDQ